MKNQQQNLDNYFYIASRFIIVVPIVVVIFGILLKLTGGDSQQKSFKDYNVMLTPSISQNQLDNINSHKKATPSARLNFTGPFNCFFSANSATISAHIKDKKLYLEVDEKKVIQNYLLSGDCFYIWKKASYSGEKICGISQQVAIVEGLLSSGLINPDLIFENLEKVLPISPIGKSQEALKSALSSCNNAEIPSSVQLEIPKNVLFKNKTLK